MMKIMDEYKQEQVIILGATGSIGTSTAKVLRREGGKFNVCGLAAGRASEVFVDQIREFGPNTVVLRDQEQAQKLLGMLGDSGSLKVSYGQQGLEALASAPRVEKVLNALSGAAGIRPSLAAAGCGKQLLLANKEALVAAGELIMRTARHNRARIIPVDSEHSAIFQCLRGESEKSVGKLLITASGGPFFNLKDHSEITPEMALKHPKWSMGPKITVDSATLMNKGLEVIEAMWLFDISIEKIQVVVHPECIVHSMVEFTDGVTMAQLSVPDMTFPISYALNYPERSSAAGETLDFSKISKLNFMEPDMKRFPCLELALEAARAGGLIPAMVSAADEVAVAAFLDKQIGFMDIPRILESVMNRGVEQGAHREEVTLAAITEFDASAREQAKSFVPKANIVKAETETAKPKQEKNPEESQKKIVEAPAANPPDKDKPKTPRHVAIIMDGNGRWAQKRGLPRVAGHKAGADRVRPIMEYCREVGIEVLTLYAFSTENWQRPEQEVSGIMRLLDKFLDRETEQLVKDKVRLCFPGNPERITPELREKMQRATERTSKDYKNTLNVCINYGGRDEILQAVNRLMERKREQGEDIGEADFSESLYTSGLPDPDIVIRTGGDHRISNFLLWQIAYAEIFFHPKFWPDFMPEDLAQILEDFGSRERRFGCIREDDARLLPGIGSPADLKKLPADRLERLAGEIRDVVIEKVSERGGHLASNLGIVELTIALHRVFETPEDKIVWDVGHQCYPHKLLTGRFQDFERFRRDGGASGFPKRSESEHDSFNTGHGSTSISAALGMAAGRDINRGSGRVISVCGDGAMSGGMIYEALNHAGDLKSNLLVVLNDNSYSISPVTGALGRFLSGIRTNQAYVDMHQRMELFKDKPSSLFRALSFVSHPVRSLGKYLAFRKGISFEEIGFKYVGPVNGHDIDDLIKVFQKIQRIKGPVLLHVLTQKGRGYAPAESDPASFHGVSRIAPPEDNNIDIKPPETFTRAFSKTLDRVCEQDPRIVGITAAMASGTGLSPLFEKYPDRFFDVGMAEQHAVTFAAGLATQGIRPVVAVYSTFLQRAYDQIFHDVCLQDLPVVFALDRAGLVSNYGQTHQGLMDIAYLRNLPNIILLAPRDTVELEVMLEYAFTQEHPVAVRYPSGRGDGAVRTGARAPMEHATAEVLVPGEDVAIWAVGPLAPAAVRAAQILKQKGIRAGVINPRFVHPMDEQTLIHAVESGVSRFVTVEDHLLAGGFGSLFLEKIHALGLQTGSVLRLGVDDCMVRDRSRAQLLKDYSLDGPGIAQKILDTFGVGDAAQLNND